MEPTDLSFAKEINTFINELDFICNNPNELINRNISSFLKFSEKILENQETLKKIKWSQITIIDDKFKKIEDYLKKNKEIKKVGKKIKEEVNSTKLLISTKLGNIRKNKNELKKFILDLCNGKITHPMSIQEAIDLIKNADADFKDIILKNSDLFSLYEYKTGTILEKSPIEIKDCISEQIEKGKTILSQEYYVPIAIDRLRKQRMFALNNLELVYKKSTEQLESVKHKCFPPTIAWYVGSNKDNAQAPFEYQMQEIAFKHDIKLITDNPDHDLAFQKTLNTLIFSDNQIAAFPQDFVDFSRNEARVPVMLSSSYPSYMQMQENLKNAREIRDTDWRKINPSMQRAPSQFLPRIGAVLRNELQKKAIGLALAMGITLVMNLTHGEGGNTLLGMKGDSMFAIIGKDSYELSKLIMEIDLGRHMSEEEVRMAFAIDYGITKEMVYFVEQPGDFHLDMNLAIIGPNTVVVNDALLAQKKFKNENNIFLNNDVNKIKEAEKKNQAYFEIKKQFEDKTEKDLKKYGFNVIRFPGVFYRLTPYARLPVMNFFNMVTAETPSRTKLVVAMGVINEEYKNLFFEMIEKGDYFKNFDKNNIYFFDMTLTEQTLLMHGGISCRTKTI